MNPEAMKPHGKALLDYHHGNVSAAVTIVRDDGWTDVMPTASFFRQADSLDLERLALDLCTGQILDAGAGTGLHTLFLQNKGFKVTAIDVVPEAIQIMRERGISDAQQADIMTFGGSHFDTILMMGHGIGMVENIAGLAQFLVRTHDLLSLTGQVLLTSLDARITSNPTHLEYQKRNLGSGRYVGEIRMQFKYREIEGPFFGWLHVDPETLKTHAERHNWVCDLVSKQDDGNYLASLTRKQR